MYGVVPDLPAEISVWNSLVVVTAHVLTIGLCRAVDLDVLGSTTLLSL